MPTQQTGLRRTRIGHDQSYFRLYPAEFLRQVPLRPDTGNTFVCEGEILIIAAHLIWYSEAVAVETIYHRDGTSNYRAWTDTWQIVRRVAGHLFRRWLHPAGLLRVLCLLPDPRAEGP